MQNEETVLLKSFKYFDLNNNGTVEPEEFAKAVEKIGIMIPTRQVSSRRFPRRKRSSQLAASFSFAASARNETRGMKLAVNKL